MKRSKPLFSSMVLVAMVALFWSCDSGKSTNDDPALPSESPALWNKSDYGIPWNNAISYGYVVDSRDGNVYRTVAIGTQTWMAENLNHKVDSSWWVANGADSGAKYGRLYTWASAMKLPASCNSSSCASQVQSKHQGVCPSDWHVPSDAEWVTLSTSLGGETAGVKLRSTNGWSNNGVPGNGTDTYGFRALPAGWRVRDRSFSYVIDYVGREAYFWTSSESWTGVVMSSSLYSGSTNLGRGDSYSTDGLSVRCLKDGP